MNQPIEEKWKESYPLSTFKGETKKELVAFIENLLEQERQRMSDEIERIPIANTDLTDMLGRENASGWNSCRQRMMAIINK